MAVLIVVHHLRKSIGREEIIRREPGGRGWLRICSSDVFFSPTRRRLHGSSGVLVFKKEFWGPKHLAQKPLAQKPGSKAWLKSLDFQGQF
jgi:hypothetical protein